MKKINLKDLKIKIFSYIYSLAMIFGLVVLVLVSIFLYKNFYSTILTLSDIILMQEGVSDNNINIDKFNKIIDNFNINNEAEKADANIENNEEKIEEANVGEPSGDNLK